MILFHLAVKVLVKVSLDQEAEKGDHEREILKPKELQKNMKLTTSEINDKHRREKLSNTYLTLMMRRSGVMLVPS